MFVSVLLDEAKYKKMIHKPFQPNRKQALKAYCPNIHIYCTFFGWSRLVFLGQEQTCQK